MDKIKVLVIGTHSYGLPFKQLGMEVVHLNRELPEEFDFAVFTGGEDVDPSLYGAKKLSTTMSNIERDKRELKLFKEISKLGKPMVGICRGAQFLTVMNGGALLQHVDRHAIGSRLHKIITNKNKELYVTSTHHQMMSPHVIKNKENYELVAWADPDYNNHRYMQREPEVVWYSKHKCLAVQFHPEHVTMEHECRQYFNELLKEYIL